jgi:Ca2+-binding RTX toxin-like protein
VTFSAAGWTFSNWTGGVSGGDIISITGTLHDDNLTGSSQNDQISGGPGRDVLHGGGGDDQFYYGNPVDCVSAEIVDGGGEQDIIFVTGSGQFDFSGMTISGVEALDFQNPSNMTAILSGTQIGGTQMAFRQSLV